MLVNMVFIQTLTLGRKGAQDEYLLGCLQEKQ